MPLEVIPFEVIPIEVIAVTIFFDLNSRAISPTIDPDTLMMTTMRYFAFDHYLYFNAKKIIQTNDYYVSIILNLSSHVILITLSDY